MKLQAILNTGLATTLAAFTLGVQAAPDTATPAEAKVPTAEAPAKTTPKKVKPHNHMEEKGYAPVPTGNTPGQGASAADLADKHLHPRDAK